MRKKLLSLLLICLIGLTPVMGIVACGGGGGEDDTPSGTQTQKEVSTIAVDTLPTTTEYYVGDTFSLEGGYLLVTYTDGTTEKVAMTDEDVTTTDPDMSKTGDKTITVTYGSARTRFTISVANQGFKLTLDYGYDTDSTVINVVKGQAASRPTDPERTGYTFYNWYSDEDCTVAYDFSTVITADTTIYAVWKQDGVTYYEVTYDLNYYGESPSQYTQLVKSGETAKTLAITPTRSEYTFNGWFSDEAASTAYTSAAIAADTTIYAGWTKTKTGSSTYTFEAELTDLSGKTGPGFSGSAQEEGMIVTNSTASGGKAVSYMYKNGNTLEFYIASDEAVSDATLVLSLAAEMDNIIFTSDQFQVIVNDTVLSYTSVSLASDSTFTDAVTIENVALSAGLNTIVLKVNNSIRPMGDASTYAATAPMIDCVKITTTAVLTWDANYGLPMSY